MRRATEVLAGVAVATAAFDLGHKTLVEGAIVHPRSAGYVAVVVTLVVGWCAALVLVRSAALSAAGGVVAGGGIGNAVAAGIWGGVPNPIVVDAVAFNLADLFVVGGFVAVALVVLVLLAVERERLRSPIHVLRAE